MKPKDIQTTHDVVRWLRNYVEWSDEASRDMMLRAVDVLTLASVASSSITSVSTGTPFGSALADHEQRRER